MELLIQLQADLPPWQLLRSATAITHNDPFLSFVLKDRPLQGYLAPAGLECRVICAYVPKSNEDSIKLQEQWKGLHSFKFTPPAGFTRYGGEFFSELLVAF
jgi:hypothetical protein